MRDRPRDEREKGMAEYSASDDEWCPDCGETLPCMCDDFYDDEREADEEDEE